jgi:Tol biopolymer transport system component
MKNKLAIAILCLIITITVSAQDIISEYFGQTPPGIIAEKFNGGKFFEDENHKKRSFNLTFSPAEDEMFFSYYKGTKEIPHPEYEIKTSKLIDGVWSYPETAEFSGVYSDVDINFSPDGKYIFFASDQPQPHSIGLDIYYCVKTNTGWSEPIYAGTDINTTEGEVYPSSSSKKHVFFRSSRSGGYSDSDLYRADWVFGNFINVKNLGPNVNSPYGQSNAVIASDESYILLCTLRPDNERWQIFVSFQIGDNVWTKAVSLGPEVNTSAGAGAPTITPDGKYLIFSKRKGPDRGLYWISTGIIENIRKEILKEE